MTYSEIKKLVEQNRANILKGIDVDFNTKWNQILERKMNEVRKSVYSKYL